MKFGFAREKSFARDLVNRLAKELPAELVPGGRQPASVNKITRQLEKTYKSAALYQSAHQIGFVRRAVLANAFRWGLAEVGYPQEFINIAVEGLVVEFSRATKPRDNGAGTN